MKTVRWFLRNDYRVVFLHRRLSLQPFSWRFRQVEEGLLNFVHLSKDKHGLVVDNVDDLVPFIAEYEKVSSADNPQIYVIGYYVNNSTRTGC